MMTKNIKKKTTEFIISHGYPDGKVKAYVTLFKAETGCGDIFAILRLPRNETGKCFGDFYRGLLRSILPIALNVAMSALSAISDA